MRHIHTPYATLASILSAPSNKCPYLLSRYCANSSHCPKNIPHFTFYTAEATNAIALRRYDEKLREEILRLVGHATQEKSKFKLRSFLTVQIYHEVLSMAPIVPGDTCIVFFILTYSILIRV
jgi:hypothetical protein